MVDEKKKKQNRKKKNKQNKTAEDLAEGVAGVTSAGENHVTTNGEGESSKDTESADVQDDPLSVVGEDQESHFPNESDIASLLEQIKHLQNEEVNHIHKESFLEEQVKQLQKDKDMFMQKEIRLEENIAELLHEKEVFLQKEVCLEEKVKQMDGEIKSWLQKENSNKEAINFLNGDISRLQMQVSKSEQLKESLLQENQLMAQTISGLQMQILNLEKTAALSLSIDSKLQTVTSELEDAHTQVEKLMTENAKLVEKVNGLQTELKYNGVQKQGNNPPDSSSDLGTRVFVSGEITEIGEHDDLGATEHRDIPLVTDVVEVETPENALATNVSSEITEIEEHDDQEQRKIAQNSLEKTSEMDEIVQISLDENERETTDNTLTVYNDEKIEVPISDAPLIGAPFRLISFMARYVSGADLIDKNSVSRGG